MRHPHKPKHRAFQWFITACVVSAVALDHFALGYLSPWAGLLGSLVWIWEK